MFTGLIEAVCKINSLRRSTEAITLTIDLGILASDAKIGDSICINGVCLTITTLSGSVASFDVSAETLAKSTISQLQSSSPVNAERALRASDRLGGHVVQGHVDGTATIKSVNKQGDFATITFQTAPELLAQMIVKGSVAVNGISLTISDIDTNGFSVAIIPQTLENTTLANAKTGDTVNIETDIMTKTVKKLLEQMLPTKGNLTVDKLQELGF